MRRAVEPYVNLNIHLFFFLRHYNNADKLRYIKIYFY